MSFNIAIKFHDFSKKKKNQNNIKIMQKKILKVLIVFNIQQQINFLWY